MADVVHPEQRNPVLQSSTTRIADMKDKLQRALVELCVREDAGGHAALALVLKVLHDHVDKQVYLGSRQCTPRWRMLDKQAKN